jgi:hypothetical protein
MIPSPSVKLAAGLTFTLIRIPVFVTKASLVNFKKQAAGFFGNQNRMISTASRAIRKIILAVKHFSRRVFENAKGSNYIESISVEFPTTAEEKVQRPAMYSPDSERSESKAETGRSGRSRRETIVGADCPTRGWQAGAEMNESEQDGTENTAVSRSQWKSAAVLVLILASIAMPCFTVLQLKGGSSVFRIPPLLYGLWAAFALWVALDAANFLRVLGLRVDDALAPGALALSGLGVVNLVSVFGALFMMSRL